jgi:predicted transcriptional regulator
LEEREDEMVEEFRSALSRREVPMVEPEAVARIRGLRAAGWGAKRIAREMEMRRNTVRRYLKGGEGAPWRFGTRF